jgi:hypothetical protein
LFIVSGGEGAESRRKGKGKGGKGEVEGQREGKSGKEDWLRGKERGVGERWKGE